MIPILLQIISLVIFSIIAFGAVHVVINCFSGICYFNDSENPTRQRKIIFIIPKLKRRTQITNSGSESIDPLDYEITLIEDFFSPDEIDEIKTHCLNCLGEDLSNSDEEENLKKVIKKLPDAYDYAVFLNQKTLKNSSYLRDIHDEFRRELNAVEKLDWVRESLKKTESFENLSDRISHQLIKQGRKPVNLTTNLAG